MCAFWSSKSSKLQVWRRKKKITKTTRLVVIWSLFDVCLIFNPVVFKVSKVAVRESWLTNQLKRSRSPSLNEVNGFYRIENNEQKSEWLKTFGREKQREKLKRECIAKNRTLEINDLNYWCIQNWRTPSRLSKILKYEYALGIKKIFYYFFFFFQQQITLSTEQCTSLVQYSSEDSLFVNICKIRALGFLMRVYPENCFWRILFWYIFSFSILLKSHRLFKILHAHAYIKHIISKLTSKHHFNL